MRERTTKLISMLGTSFKPAFVLFVLSILVSSSSLHAQSKVIDRVVARVGGELVFLSEYEEQLSHMMSQTPEAINEDTKCLVFEQLLVAKLLINQAKLDSVEVSSEEVDAQLDARFERILGLMNNDLKQFEEYYGQTVSEVRAQFADDLRNQMLSERMRSNIVKAARITPSEVKAFYNEIPTDSLPYFSSEVEYKELIYTPKVNAEEEKKALSIINDLRNQIVNDGADFGELAKKYSEDKGSGRDGGNLGWAGRGTFVPEFEATVYNLSPNEVSEVVETEFGFHIIQLLERRGSRIRARHILIKPAIVSNDLDLAKNLLDSVRLQISNDSISFRQAVAEIGAKKAQSFNNGGRVTNPSTGDTFFDANDLDPITFFAMDTLEVGSITGPVEFEDPRSKAKIYKIFKLESRSSPHQASLETDYNKIKKAAIEAKKTSILSDWVTEKIGKTYIKMDPVMLENCNLSERWKTKS